MANKRVKQYIQEKLQDPHYGSHQEVKIGESKLKADWLYTYGDGKAILIEDKEEGDSSFEKGKEQVKKYKEELKKIGYEDFITIVVKDLKDNIKVEVWHNDQFEGNILNSLKFYEQKLGTKPIVELSNDIYIYI